MAEKLDVDAVVRDYRPVPFESKPFYAEEGDSIQLFFEDVDTYAERVDCWLTIFKSFEHHRVAGFMLKNVKPLLSAFRELHIDVFVSGSKWQINLEALVQSIPWVIERSLPLDAYKELLPHIQEREDNSVAVAAC